MIRTRQRRLAFLLALAALLPAVPAAVAGPLDPPRDTLRVWLVKRQGTAARKLTSVVYFRQRQRSWSALFIVGFRMHGTRRDLYQGKETIFGFGDADNPYPYAYAGPVATPPCPADALCSWPEQQPEPLWTRRGLPITPGQKPTTLSFYVMSANNDQIEITSSPGWTIREISAEGAAMRATHGDGVGVHVGHGLPGVTRFTGARLDAEGPSVAVGLLPCNPGLTYVNDHAVLSGGDTPRRPFETRMRETDCGVVRGSGSTPTTWTFTGQSTAGVYSNGQTLAVAVLPRQT